MNGQSEAAAVFFISKRLKPGIEPGFIVMSK
jgi:hypothetical protein